MQEFNSLMNSMEIDEFKYGSRVDNMDLIIFEGTRFHQKGMCDIKIFQNEQNLYAFIQKRNHKKHTIFFFCGERT